MTITQVFSKVYLIVLAIILLLTIWFGLGAWMRSQPSTLLYWTGTALDLLAVYPVALVVKEALYKKTKESK